MSEVSAALKKKYTRRSRWWFFFFFSSRRRHTRWNCDWSSDVCSSDLLVKAERLADSGDTDGAIAAYREAQSTCRNVKPARRRQQACGDALLGEAEVQEQDRKSVV